jgi:hypothetical protein
MYLIATIPSRINSINIPMLLFPVTCFDRLIDLETFSFETFWVLSCTVLPLLCVGMAGFFCFSLAFAISPASLIFSAFSWVLLFSVVLVIFFSYSEDVSFEPLALPIMSFTISL